MTICRCVKIDHISGADAQKYISSHLKEVEVNDQTWEILFICPITKLFWIEKYLHSESQGGGSPDLVKISEDDARKKFIIK